MKALLQRVVGARVQVDGDVVGACGPGLLVLVGILRGDGPREAERLARRVAQLRIFEDAAFKLNLSAQERGAQLLVVSQFTLAGDCTGGRRPSFESAERAQAALPLFERFVAALRASGLRTQTGRFGAAMRIEAELDGPVTLLLEEPPALPRAGAGGSAPARA